MEIKKMKWLGIGVVLFGSTALGVYKSCVYMNRLSNLLEIKKAFLFIQSQIRYMNTPAPELCQLAARRIRGPFRHFFETMAKCLEQRNAGDFKEIWTRCMEEISEDALEREAREEFLEMGGQLGCLDRQAQEKAIDFFLEKWEFLIEKRRGEKSNRLRLYYTCGIMGGLLVILILV